MTVKSEKVIEKKTKKLSVEEVRRQEKVNSLIYCGPSIQSGGLLQYAVFTRKLPDHVEKHIENCPAIKELLVPVSKLAECKQKVDSKGTKEQIMYDRIMNYVRGDK